MSERVGKGKAISTAYARGILLSPLSSLLSLSSLSPLASVLFSSSLPQVATGFVKMRPGSSANPANSLSQFAPRVRAQTLSVSQCSMFNNPCQSVSWLCSKSRNCGSLAAFFVISSLFSLFSALFSLLTSLCALLSSLVSLLPSLFSLPSLLSSLFSLLALLSSLFSRCWSVLRPQFALLTANFASPAAA